LRTGQPIEAARDYAVAGWASVNEGTEGPPIWDVVMSHVARRGVVAPKETEHVRVLGV
jgi:sulfur-oxidizing protein SoxB